MPGATPYTILFGAFVAALIWIRIALGGLLGLKSFRARRWLDGGMIALALPGIAVSIGVDRMVGVDHAYLADLYVLTLAIVVLLAAACTLGYAGFGLQRAIRRARTAQRTPAESGALTGVAAPGLSAANAANAANAAKLGKATIASNAAKPQPAPNPAIGGNAEPVTAPVTAPVTGPVTGQATAQMRLRPAVSEAPPLDILRRRWLSRTGAGVLGLSAAVSGGALWTDLGGLKVRHVRLQFPNLPPAFEGYRILQLSDLHSGIYMNRRAMEAARAVAETAPSDLVMFTGDQVDRAPDELPDFLAAFRGLAGRDGVAAILGNHDYFIDGEAVRRGLNAGGIPVLVNEHLRLQRGEQALTIAGLDDIWAQYNRHAIGPRPTEALAGCAPSDFKIALAHNPLCFRMCRRAGYDLTLCGHTHGGQIDLIFNALSPAHLLGPYIKGLYVTDRRQMYVNVGIGYVGLPIRIGVPPEIVQFTLTRGTPPADNFAV